MWHRYSGTVTNADKLAEDYTHLTKTVAKGDKLTVPMAPGGGFAIVLRQQ